MRFGAALITIGAAVWIWTPTPIDWAGLIALLFGVVWFFTAGRPPLIRPDRGDYITDPSRFQK